MYIDRIVFTPRYITIESDKGEYYPIKRSDFEDWATDNQKREYCGSEFDPALDGPNEDSGIYAWEVYYALERFEQDIADYISINKLIPKA